MFIFIIFALWAVDVQLKITKYFYREYKLMNKTKTILLQLYAALIHWTYRFTLKKKCDIKECGMCMAQNWTVKMAYLCISYHLLRHK